MLKSQQTEQQSLACDEQDGKNLTHPGELFHMRRLAMIGASPPLGGDSGVIG